MASHKTGRKIHLQKENHTMRQVLSDRVSNARAKPRRKRLSLIFPAFVVVAAATTLVLLLVLTSGSSTASDGKVVAGTGKSVTTTGVQTSVTNIEPVSTNPGSAQPSGNTSSGDAPSAVARGYRQSMQRPAFDLTKRASQPPLTTESAFVTWGLSHTPETEGMLRAKWAREQQMPTLGRVTDRRILQAFLWSPREYFVLGSEVVRAYDNAAMPIGYGQTISGPFLVARMTQAIDPQPNQKVLEVGTGSGYQSSVLAELSDHVYTIEIVTPLYERANTLYNKHAAQYPEYNNITRENADGYYGWARYAPFDRIIVTCGIDHVPPDLLKQLAPGGIMVIPVGPPSGQTVLKITKRVDAAGNVTLTREDIYHGRKVIFVPFTSKNGLHSLSSDNAGSQ